MPHYLRQDTSSILKTCEPTGPFEDVSVGILIVYEDCSKCVVLQNQWHMSCFGGTVYRHGHFQYSKGLWTDGSQYGQPEASKIHV
ncbi:hypothetical protein AALO_G00052380 [Alosa alosa]|uniref:Uncharacterized protein n=1 Tax=Alosa alosa TaxID=278164 RepID=A0AAV6H4D7_9TELE|nr:hypothetical protein AALO_G00052380 [Alosa alosa]